MRHILIFFSFFLGISGNVNSQIFNRKKIKNKEQKEKIIVTDSVNIVSFKDSTNERIYPVQIFMQHYIPYCGGAAPNWDQMNNYNPMANTNYHLIDLETGKKSKVLTDENGYLKLRLPTGKYGIQELFKDCTFGEFQEKFKIEQTDFILPKDSECYKNWWQSNLGEFEVISQSETQSSSMTESESCFTGNNPCIIYIGPYPP